MKGWGAALLFVCLLSAGCLGAASTASPSQSPNRPYTEVAILPASGVELREPDCDPRPCSEYYHVQIWGSENATRIRGPEQPRAACQKPWLFTSVSVNKSLLYNAGQFEPDREMLKTIISTNFWGAQISASGVSEGCPTSYHLDQPTEFPQSYARPIGSYGSVRFNVYRDGSIWLDGHDYLIEPGNKVVVSYARQRPVDDVLYYVTGGFEIVNMGPWPVESLLPQPSGTVSRGPG